MTKTVRGFTLVELSIVLIIIGLITSGIVGGQSLVRSAKLSSVVADVNKIKMYLNTFELKYDEIAGDMYNAKDYWSTCIDVDSYYPCNGNGDGLINKFESYRLFEHLSLANIIPGGHQLKTPIDLSDFLLGSSINNAFYNVRSRGRALSTSSTEENAITLQRVPNNATGVLTPAETYGIDKKIDDGAPLTGIVQAQGYKCLKEGRIAKGGGSYDLALDEKVCTLAFFNLK